MKLEILRQPIYNMCDLKDSNGEGVLEYMFNRLSNLSPSTSSRLRCGFWVAILLAHAPIILKSIATILAGNINSLDPAGSVSLLLASLLFVLKIVDVPWLRFKTDRRSCCALALAVVLLHVNALCPDQGEIIAEPPVLLMANMLMVGSVSSVRQVLRNWTQSVYSSGSKAQQFLLCWQGKALVLDLSPQLICGRQTSPRAPPL